MSKIYDLTIGYRITRRTENFTFRQYYSKITVLGKENIPEKGPVIISPNHRNALMDALLVLHTTPWELSTVFIARGDIFKKGFVANALRFMKILPAFRMRDGYENLGKNNDTIEEASETLETYHSLCIFPEGNQGDRLRLQPLVKGIFRIAFSAQEKIGDTEDIKIIPVGIDYSNRERFGEEVLINYGAPLSVSEYLPAYKENPALTINQFRAKLHEKMREKVIHLDTETYHDCFETALEASNTRVAEQLFGKNDPASRFHARQHIAKKLVKMEAEEPERVAELDKICADYRKLKAETKLTTAVIEKPLNVPALILQKLLLFVGLPVFAIGFLLNIIPFALPVLIRKKIGVQYNGFFSSFEYVLGILIFPIYYLIQTILFAVLVSSTWWMVLIFAVSQFFFGKIAFCWLKSAKTAVNKMRLVFADKKKVQKMRKIFDEINAIIIR